MNATSYWIGINTGVDYDPESYDEAAGTLVNMLTSLLADANVLKQITHSASVTSALAEIEVGLESTDSGRELVGKAVLDVAGPEKVQLDKPKLSKLIKARAEADNWPKMTITKKRVPDPPRRFDETQ